MNWLRSLFHSDDREADSIVAGGLVAIVALIGLSIYATIQSPGWFTPLNFGSSVTAILTGIGGGRQLRDWKRKDPQ